MIGLPLLAHVLEALPAGARLTLIGDSDQLASVERGRVFRDLCAMEGAISIAKLSESKRFESGSPIDLLARAINARYEVIDKWYHGRVERMDMNVLARICYVLECRPEDIIIYIK